MSYKEYEFDSVVEWKDCDIDCTIVFEHTPSTNMTIDCPAFSAEVELCSVMIDGEKGQPAIDVSDLIGSKQTERLDVASFEFVAEENKNDLENYADYKYQLTKDEGLM